MGANCTPLVADMFLLLLFFVMRETSCCLFLTKIKQIFVEAFNSTSRNLDDFINTDTPRFAQMLS